MDKVFASDILKEQLKSNKEDLDHWRSVEERTDQELHDVRDRITMLEDLNVSIDEALQKLSE